MDAVEIVDQMDLVAGHVLTEQEAEAILVVGGMAIALQKIQRVLGVEH